MSSPMRHLELRRLGVGICGLLLAGTHAACDGGVVRPLALIAAEQTSAGRGGTDASAAGQPPAGRGGSAGPRAGRGGFSAPGGVSGGGDGGSGGNPLDSCVPDEASVADEMELLRALNRSIEMGRFCPGMREPLMSSRELQDYTHYGVCFGTIGPSWRQLPWRTWSWSTVASSLEEAKTALFEEDRRDFCESASHVMYEIVGVARLDDNWAVVIADSPSGPAGDMQKQ